jgi:hypothetical protein
VDSWLSTSSASIILESGQNPTAGYQFVAYVGWAYLGPSAQTGPQGSYEVVLDVCANSANSITNCPT